MNNTETTLTATEQVEQMAQDLDFGQLSSMYLTVAGVILPVVIGVIAIKKGIKWIKGGIKSV